MVSQNNSAKKLAGILLPISSLPSPHGIGCFSKEAYDFCDFLKETGQTFWQVLPLGQTSFGDSPYQSPSAFAGNPYFIDLDALVAKNLLTTDEVESADLETEEELVDYGKQFENRYPLLRKAYARFDKNEEAYHDFLKNSKFWIEDYALFMSIKTHHGDLSFLTWPKPLKLRDKDAIESYIKENEDDINFWKFTQFEFFSQYAKLKEYANSLGLKIIGDMPIYVALDSSDVWANPARFLLDENMTPKLVAGVPPDMFTEDGQLWGNPLYDWEHLKKNNYDFWKERISDAFSLFDYVRIDHFRGFESYFAVEFGSENARKGTWNKGPGTDLFIALSKDIDVSRIIAEDLGFMTEGVKKLLKDTGYPGMKILIFGFDTDETDEFLPKQYPFNSIAYSGTHDNETTMQFVSGLTCEKLALFEKVMSEIPEDSPVDKVIAGVLSSPSKFAIIPIQDYLHLGEEGRMNFPSKPEGWWRFRLKKSQLTCTLLTKIKSMTEKYRG